MQKFFRQRAVLVPAGYIAATLLIIAVWLLLAAPELKKMPDNFSYYADILSLDNFFDENTGKFEGEHISKTRFGFGVVSRQPAYLTIKNTFDVQKISGKPIFSVSREYYINPWTGQHVAVTGSEKRNGYLFAPHYLSGQPFYYWHINYDAPALMKFVKRETINGLTVYRYAAAYQAEQTENLSRLPGVPEKRGVRTDIMLQLWVEPVTGWLVKYQDNTLAYYYDRQTGARLNPWNRFSNRYTENSIAEKTDQAKKLKIRFLAADFGVPLLVVMASLMIFFRKKCRAFGEGLLRRPLYYWRRNTEIIVTLAAYCLITVTAAGSAYYILYYGIYPPVYKIGIAQWNNSAESRLSVRGFRDGLEENGFRAGINIVFSVKNAGADTEKQISIIRSFVRDKVDLIFTMTTPAVLVAKGMAGRIPVVFTDVSYPVEAEIVSANGGEKSTVTGMLSYIPPARQFYRFDILFPDTKVLGFLRQKGDPDSEIMYREYKKVLGMRNIEVADIPASDSDDAAVQLSEKLNTAHFNALFVACDTLIRSGAGRVAAEFSKKNRIPAFTCDEGSVKEGILTGYFTDLYAAGKQAGVKASLILRGADPDWLRTEPLRGGVSMTNRKTAELLGIRVPAPGSAGEEM